MMKHRHMRQVEAGETFNITTIDGVLLGHVTIDTSVVSQCAEKGQ